MSQEAKTLPQSIVEQRIPSWTESSANLTARQKIAASLESNMYILQAFHGVSKVHLYRLQSDRVGSKEDGEIMITQHVGRLVDTYRMMITNDRRYPEGDTPALEEEIRPWLTMLRNKRDAIFFQAQNWGVNETDEVDSHAEKFLKKHPSAYRVFLDELTGLVTQPEATAVQSWEKTKENLTERKKAAAEIASTVAFLKAFRQDAKKEHAWKKRRAMNRGDETEDADLHLEHIARLFDAYIRLQAANVPDNSPINTALPLLADNDESYYANRLSRILPGLKKEKDSIFYKAQSWEDKEIRKVTRQAYNYLLTIPRIQQNLLYAHTELLPDNIIEGFLRLATSAGANYGSFILLNTIGLTSGAFVRELGILEHVDPKLVFLAFVISEGIWAAGVVKNAQATAQLLEEEGISTSIVAKLSYEFARRRTDNEKLLRYAAYAGVAVQNLIEEVPYIATAFLPVIFSGNSVNSGLSFLLGGSLGAAGYEFLLAYITLAGLSLKNNVPVIREKIKNGVHVVFNAPKVTKV